MPVTAVCSVYTVEVSLVASSPFSRVPLQRHWHAHQPALILYCILLLVLRNVSLHSLTVLFIFNLMKTVETSVPCEPLTHSLCSRVTSWWTKVGKSFKAWISQHEAECPLSYWVTKENAITASSLAGWGLLWVVRTRLWSLWLHLVNGWWWTWEQITAGHCGESCCHLTCDASPIRTVSCVFIHAVPETGMQLKTINKRKREVWLVWSGVHCQLHWPAGEITVWGIPGKAHRQDPWDTSELDVIPG